MASLTVFLVVYLFGGLTFLPLLLAAAIYVYTKPAPPSDDSDDSDEAVFVEQSTEKLPLLADEKPLRRTSHASSYASNHHHAADDTATAGYFAVFRKYVAVGVNSKPIEPSGVGPSTVPSSPSVYQTFFRGMLTKKGGNGKSRKDKNGARDRGESIGDGTLFDNKGRTNGGDEVGGAAATVEVSSAASPRPRNARNMFYVVLRHGHLILFDDDQQVDVRHVIKLADHDVGMYAGEDNAIPEGELFIKRSALRLAPRHPERAAHAHNVPAPQPWFFYNENCSEKEDFYFALLRSQSQEGPGSGGPGAGLGEPIPRPIDVRHLTSLMERLHASEEAAETRWLNAMLGRMFLGVYRTPEVLNFIQDKVVKKLSRAPRPGFIARLAVQRVEIGETTPQITSPRLKSLTAEGECVIEADVRYVGHFAVDVAATMRVSTPIGPQEVKTSLAVAFTRLEGHVLFKIKAPPSNRIWFSFRHMPKLDMEIRPIILARQLTWPVLIQMIEGRIKEAIAESIVLPFWDDTPFFGTEHKIWRGGVWTDDSGTRCDRRNTASSADGVADEDSENASGESPAVQRLRRLSQNYSTPSLASTSEGKTSKTPINSVPPLAKRLSSRTSSSLSSSSPALGTEAMTVHAEALKASAKAWKNGAAASMERLSRSARERTSSASSESGGGDNNERHEETPPAEGETEATATTTTPDLRTVVEDDNSAPVSVGPSSARTSSTSLPIRAMAVPAGLDGPEPSSFAPSMTTTISGGSPSFSGSGNGSKRSTALAAVSGAAASAKRWGINALQRRAAAAAAAAAERKARQQGPVDLSKPMGGGRPLPPPGEPLPMPEELARANRQQTIRRKPLRTPSTQIQRDEREELIEGLRRRGADMGGLRQEDVMVVQAPVDSEEEEEEEEGQEEIGEEEAREGREEEGEEQNEADVQESNSLDDGVAAWDVDYNGMEDGAETVDGPETELEMATETVPEMPEMPETEEDQVEETSAHVTDKTDETQAEGASIH